MEKQTAVDWLIDQLEKYELYSKISFQCLKEIEQAKEIEKQQIKNAHTHNRCINNQTYDCTIEAFYNAEQYYNETFGGKDEQ
jgi:vacuolar-type H+-ATPase subunit H